MRFQKISNHSIRCFISRAEMDEKGLEMDELMGDREKAGDFLRYILQEARYAVDFHTNGNVLNVQMAMTKDGDLALTISDDEDSAIRNIIAEMKNHLQQLKSSLEEQKESDEKQEDDPDRFDGQKLLDAVSRAAGIVPAGDGKTNGEMLLEDPDEYLTLPLWVAFDSLDECIRFSGKFPELREKESFLYKYEDRYYLMAALHGTRKELARIAFKVSDQADGMYADDADVAEIAEHGQILRKHTALKDLGDLL